MKLSKLIKQLQEMQRTAGPDAEVYKQCETRDSVELITRLERYLPGRLHDVVICI